MVKFGKLQTGLNDHYFFKIYAFVSELPEGWNELAAKNIFLTTDYLKVLEQSAPENITCHFIGLFQNHQLVGIALSQFLNSDTLQSFGERDRCLKTYIRNFFFKTFTSHVLFIGNNMLTGQNAFCFSDKADANKVLQTIEKASAALEEIFKQKGFKIHIVTIKDFILSDTVNIEKSGFKNYYRFSTQPNMLFEIRESWNSFDDYIGDLNKKYRDQFKRARKKANGITKRKMNIDDIIKYEDTIYELYFHVAVNAPFNTFFLARNHFRVFKELLKEKFLFYGYFIGEELIGFNTLIKNGDTVDTYFLGYDERMQREHMLYLNMLYDMVAYSINKHFKKIVFARTALEIKSSVGARPEQMFGFIKHNNAILNRYMEKIFGYMEPTTEWQSRHPFKD